MILKSKKSSFLLSELIRILLYILIYWSILALSATGQIPPTILALFAGLVTYSLLPNSLLRRLPDIIWTLFTIGAFVFAILYIRTDFLMALLFLFIYLIINKISNPIQIRDEIQVIALCFFLCVCAMTISESLLLSPVIIVYFILFSISLMLVNFHWDMEETRKAALSETTLKSREKWGTARIYDLMKYNIKFLLFILPCSLFLFLFIPRFSSYHLFTSIQDFRPNPSTTGYSENVQLGSMIGLKKDRTIVMRVQPTRNDGLPLQLPDIYVRGGSLDFYDGRQWIKSFESKRLTDIVQTNFVSFNRVSHKQKVRIPQRIHQECSICPYIMGINQPYAYQFAKPYEMSIDYESDSIRLLNPDLSNISYTAYSFTSMEQGLGKEDLKDKPDTYDITNTQYSRLYLQQPIGGWDARIAGLARQITRDAATNYEKTLRIKEYLTRNYSYSLDFAEKGVEEPIVEFLFDRKTGHCEFFATAMVVLCRAANIPARIVNGYYSGEWNNYGNYFIVRQQDAHSWVEAWFSTSEWKSFDPTPSAGLIRVESSPLVPPVIQEFYDSLKFKWQKYIIDYNLSDQIRLGSRFQKISGGISGTMERLTYQFRNLKHKRGNTGFSDMLKKFISGLGIALVVITLGAVAVKFLWKNRGKLENNIKRYEYSKNLIIEEYEDILLQLQKKGFARLPCETPKEFAREVAGIDHRLSQFLPLTLRYYALRYHHEEWTPEDRERFRRFISDLQRGWK
jgi:transglutaminase-like putative cysteine protease